MSSRFQLAAATDSPPDLRDRGLNEPKLVVGDGALGTWAALRDVFPDAREQRCWVHYADSRVMPTRAAKPLRIAESAARLSA